MLKKDKAKVVGKADEAQEQSEALEAAREKMSHFYDKYIYVLSGDPHVREMMRGHFEALSFPAGLVKISNSSPDIIAKLKFYPDKVDMVICHMKTVDGRVSGQTGIQLLKIIKDMLLNSGTGKNLPILFMEMLFGKTEIVDALKAGGSQLVILPSNPVILADKIAVSFEKPGRSSPPAEVAALVGRGNKYRDKGLFENAVICYNKALTLGGERAETLAEKGSALLLMGDVEGAIKVFQRITEIEANFPRAYQGLGDSHAQLGNIPEAKKNYMKVIKLEPDNALVHNSIGCLFQEEGDFPSAKKYFQSGIETNPKFVKNHMDLAKNHELQGDSKGALKIYRDGIKQNLEASLLHTTAGGFCLDHNMNVEAEEIYTEALKLNENHVHLYNRLGLALRRMGKYEKAIANYQKGLEIDPENANLRYNLAKAEFMFGRENEALESIHLAFNLDSELKSAIKRDVEFIKMLEKYPEKFTKI